MIQGIYLVQPSELNETNRYKFGMSKKNINSRIKNYGSETRVLCKYFTIKPNQIENLMKIILKKYIFTKKEYIKFDNEEELKIVFFTMMMKINVLYRFINKTDYKLVKMKEINDINLYNQKLELMRKIIFEKKINENIHQKINNLIIKECNEYTCIRCNKIFKSNKFNFRKHFTKKKVCNPLNINIDIKIILNEIDNNNYINFYNLHKNKKECKYCNLLMIKYNLKKHYKICKNNPDNQNNNKVLNTYHKINNITEENKIKINYNNLDLIKDYKIYNNLSFEQKSENYCNNLKQLFKEVYSLTENQNFKLINKKDESYCIKKNNSIEIINLKDLIFLINNLLSNIFKDYLEENKNCLNHYIIYFEELKQLYLNNQNLKEYNKINKNIQKCLKNNIIYLAQKNKKIDLI